MLWYDVEKSKIIRYGSIFKAETIEEISYLLTMEEKERFLNSIRAVNGDEEIVAAYRNERNERWKRESIENGLREEGKEENTISIIKNMLSEKIDYNTISKVTGKTMEEIKEIKKSHQIGDTIKLKINRNGSEKEITLTLGEQP